MCVCEFSFDRLSLKGQGDTSRQRYFVGNTSEGKERSHLGKMVKVTDLYTIMKR